MSNNRDLNLINGFWVDKEHKTFLNAIFHNEHTLAIDVWKGHPDDESYDKGAVASITIDLRTGEIPLIRRGNKIEMNQDLKEIERTLKQSCDGEMTIYQAMTRIEEIVEDALNPGMTEITPGMLVRAAEGWELEQLAVTCAIEKSHRNDHLPTKDEVQEERDFLSQAGVSVIDGYMTDSPGYCGPVYCVVWSGGPEIVTTYIIEKGRIVPTVEVKPEV